METAEQLQAKITAAHQRYRQEEARTVQLLQDVEQAKERQRMRDELERIEGTIQARKDLNSYHESFKADLEVDFVDSGDHNPDFGPCHVAPRPVTPLRAGGEAVDCSQQVVKGEYEWRIQGMSWLVSALTQDDRIYICSNDFDVGDAEFDLIYNPTGGQVGTSGTVSTQKGSLAIRHREPCGITFRYRVFVKEASGDFTQWGASGDECHPYWQHEDKAFGPDVQTVRNSSVPERTIGVFGLSHRELLQSKWVQRDSLTVKVLLEVRPGREVYASKQNIHPSVVVPPATLDTNLLSLLHSGRHSDVTFLIEGERVKAHSLILSARSEVFDRQFTCGMRESVSKEVLVEDFDITTFKTLLKFLYTDDLTDIEESVKSMNTCGVASSDSSHDNTSVTTSRIALIQNLMAVSHKYQVTRLQLWCEQRLCDCISAHDVCSILCEAHLYEAKQLEQACLAFIKQNMGIVVATPAFGSLAADWPEVMLKINIFIAGISDSCAAHAIKAEENTRKKRQMQTSIDGAEIEGAKRKRDD